MTLFESYCQRIKSAWGRRLAIRDHKLDNFFWDEDDGVQIFDLNGTKPLSGARLTPTSEETEIARLDEVICKMDKSKNIDLMRQERDDRLRAEDFSNFLDDVLIKGLVPNLTIKQVSKQGTDVLTEEISGIGGAFFKLWLKSSLPRFLQNKDNAVVSLNELIRLLKNEDLYKRRSQ